MQKNINSRLEDMQAYLLLFRLAVPVYSQFVQCETLIYCVITLYLYTAKNYCCIFEVKT